MRYDKKLYEQLITDRTWNTESLTRLANAYKHEIEMATRYGRNPNKHIRWLKATELALNTFNLKQVS